MEVHLIADAVSLRGPHSTATSGLRRMEAAGVHLSNVEMVLFELMINAAHPRLPRRHCVIEIGIKAP